MKLVTNVEELILLMFYLVASHQLVLVQQNVIAVCLHPLWRMAAAIPTSTFSMNIPSPCPPSSLNFPSSPSINPSCSTREDLDDLTREIQCSTALAPILEALNSDNCQVAARDVKILCSRRDGDFCTDIMAGNTSDLLNAVQYCTSETDCPPMCQEAINTVNINRGCCFNIFNTTFVTGTSHIYEAEQFASISDNGLWQQCGVTPPGVCPPSAAGITVISYLAAIFLLICNLYIV